MTGVTQILASIERGDPHAAERLLPLVYEELRKLAAARMAQERPDHTLQATALVHEAYVRLVDGNGAPHWDSRGHFFAAAAEAMRRILVEIARQKDRVKHGGGMDRVQVELAHLPFPTSRMRWPTCTTRRTTSIPGSARWPRTTCRAPAPARSPPSD